MNRDTGKKVYMRRKKGAYVVDVVFVDRNEEGEYVEGGVGEIKIDSACEESCCPIEFGAGFGMKDLGGEGLNLVSANGSKIKHYGSRNVTFIGRDTGF